MSNNNPFNWKLDSFDSMILGFPVAKITYDGLISDTSLLHESLVSIVNQLQDNSIRYAVCRVPGDNYTLLQSLEIHKFVLVDGLITLETKIPGNKPVIDRHIFRAKKTDHEQLIEMSEKVFFGVTRYYHDAVIPIDKANEIYRQWMYNSVKGEVADLVLVWKESGEVLGFITLQKKGQIPLVAVSQKARGKGVAKSLLTAALSTFHTWAVTDVVIETQLSNIPALRLYQSAGFKITQSHLTFRWLNKGILE